MKKKIMSFVICLAMAVSVIPTSNLQASQKITQSSQLKGSDYTSSKKLAAKLNDVFNGRIGLSATVPVGCSAMTESRMFSVRNNTTGAVTCGWQCYIYANAVYNTLFNESIGHADSLHHSKKVISHGGGYLSYEQLNKAGVRCGAYVRVASDYSGCYNSNGGHSFIILSYDKSGIVYLEGNGDNHGLVRVVDASWSEFNYSMLTRLSRKVCYVIQPTKQYYNSLYYTPEKVKLSKVQNSKDNQVKVTWKKVSNAKGYQIQYSTNKKFKSNKKTKKAKTSSKSKTITKLESGETYYFKMRAYNKADKSTVYGKWSTTKKVKVSEKEVKNKPEVPETTKTTEKIEETQPVEQETVSE